MMMMVAVVSPISLDQGRRHHHRHPTTAGDRSAPPMTCTVVEVAHQAPLAPLRGAPSPHRRRTPRRLLAGERCTNCLRFDTTGAAAVHNPPPVTQVGHSETQAALVGVSGRCCRDGQAVAPPRPGLHAVAGGIAEAAAEEGGVLVSSLTLEVKMILVVLLVLMAVVMMLAVVLGQHQRARQNRNGVQGFKRSSRAWCSDGVPTRQSGMRSMPPHELLSSCLLREFLACFGLCFVFRLRGGVWWGSYASCCCLFISTPQVQLYEEMGYGDDGCPPLRGRCHAL